MCHGLDESGTNTHAEPPEARLARDLYLLHAMMNDLSKILVPVGDDAASSRALEEAYTLAHRFGATVEVLHTWLVPIAPQPYPRTIPARANDVDFETAARKHVASLLDDRPPPPGVSVMPVVRRGSPADTILDQARDADLIVMGTAGRSGLARVLLGSTTEQVVRRAPCPVLTLRAEEDAA